MTDTNDPALEALLAEARAQFAQGLPVRARDLAALVGRGQWADARRAAHRLHGSCGTYGFASLGDAAAEIEELLIEADGPPGEPARARIEARLEEISRGASSSSGRP